jgi:hypothetical protein
MQTVLLTRFTSDIDMSPGSRWQPAHSRIVGGLPAEGATDVLKPSQATPPLATGAEKQHKHCPRKNLQDIHPSTYSPLAQAGQRGRESCSVVGHGGDFSQNCSERFAYCGSKRTDPLDERGVGTWSGCGIR